MRDPNGYRSADGQLSFYPFVGETPVLIDFEHSVLSSQEILKSGGDSVLTRSRSSWSDRLKRLLVPVKRSTLDNVAALIDALPKTHSGVTLVIGGGTVGQGMAALYDHPELRVIALDIYSSPFVQIVADAHHIPLADGCVDAVVVQAVLEHVLQPDQVVAEIWRVLRPGGVIYAETPFLQQVHEGAYDFTRFTESGHRYLFRRFALLRSGSSGGPGAQLTWSIDYFFRGLFRSRLAGKISKAAFSWLRLFDRLIPSDYASDGASGFFFLGRKCDEEVTAREIIAFYPGSERGRRDVLV
ncbi:MAG TPA: methyltransferase domain-containing protein [Sphingomonas sp.]|jgi:SAM-dependent methyltransferase|nr:methyltransferase domain-containing protein [Sphingomonas sp.]